MQVLWSNNILYSLCRWNLLVASTSQTFIFRRNREVGKLLVCLKKSPSLSQTSKLLYFHLNRQKYFFLITKRYFNRPSGCNVSIFLRCSCRFYYFILGRMSKKILRKRKKSLTPTWDVLSTEIKKCHIIENASSWPILSLKLSSKNKVLQKKKYKIRQILIT